MRRLRRLLQSGGLGFQPPEISCNLVLVFEVVRWPGMPVWMSDDLRPLPRSVLAIAVGLNSSVASATPGIETEGSWQLAGFEEVAIVLNHILLKIVLNWQSFALFPGQLQARP